MKLYFYHITVLFLHFFWAEKLLIDIFEFCVFFLDRWIFDELHEIGLLE